MEGTVQVTETADRSFLDFSLIGEMVRTGFSCLIGERVQYEYTVRFTDVSGQVSAVSVVQCLDESDLERLCSFLDRVDDLQARDRERFVFQRYDDATLQAGSATC
jgi:hypothetical protein